MAGPIPNLETVISDVLLLAFGEYLFGPFNRFGVAQPFGQYFDASDMPLPHEIAPHR